MSTRYQYVVILKRDSDRVIDRISMLLCFFSGFNFLFEQILARHFNFFLSIAAILVLVGALFTFLSGGKINGRSGSNSQMEQSARDGAGNAKEMPAAGTGRVRYKYWLLTAAIGWLGMSYLQWLSAFFFVLTFLEYQAKYPLEIGFSPDRVVINSLFRREFDWSAFNNVLLKDGLLTMDFKNNRLLQKEVDEEEEGDADEEEFNDYCRGMLRAAAGGGVTV